MFLQVFLPQKQLERECKTDTKQTCGIFVVNPHLRQLERVGTERDRSEQRESAYQH